MHGVVLDRLLISFCIADGREANWKVAQADLSNGITQPIEFSLSLTPDTWTDDGWGWKSFQESQELARICRITAQITTPRNNIRTGANSFTGSFNADLSFSDQSILYEAR